MSQFGITRALSAHRSVVISRSSDGMVSQNMIREHILPVSERRIGPINETKVMTSLECYALESVTAPTLAISTRDDGDDTCESARYTASQIRGARVFGYPTGGHMPVGHQQEANAEIVRFLKEHRK